MRQVTTPIHKVEFHAVSGLRLGHALQLLLNHLAHRSDLEVSEGDLLAAEELAHSLNAELCAINELVDGLARAHKPELGHVS